jgi:predicted nucleic acid-binding protein
LIFDTDIVVWMLRKYPPALRFAENSEPAQRRVAAVSYLELLYGCRDKAELRDLRELIRNWFTEVVSLTPDITQSANALMEEYVLARRPELVTF